jgi:hypothetical protein
MSPHAGIWPHALPESLLAKCLDKDLFEVSRIKCDGTFKKHCTVMESVALGLEESQSKKDEICRKCIKNAKILRSSYSGRDYLISNYLTKEDLVQADEILAAFNDENIQNLVYEGVEVGKIAAYEILIKFKKTSLDFNDEEMKYFNAYVKNSILSLFAFIKIYREEAPDILIAYSPQYAVNGVCARYCELNSTRVYFTEGSSNIEERYSALRVWDWTEFGLTNPAMKYWEARSAETLSTSDYSRVSKHIKRLLDASSFSVYSEPASGNFDVHQYFGIPKNKKIILASMSSYDEVYSAYYINRFPSNKYISSVFKDQLEWIKSTIEFVKDQPDLFLIVRIHPRTFPSKRNAVMALEQIELAKILENPYDNIRVNKPTDKVSIYDLYSQIDTLVTGWSATGVEAMTFKIPVVTYDKNLPSYPASIHYTGSTRDEYFENLVLAANAGKSSISSYSALGWMAFSMSVGVIRHPALFLYSEFVLRYSIFRYIYTCIIKIMPNIIKRIEASQKINSMQAHRFNKLLKNGNKCLYD